MKTYFKTNNPPSRTIHAGEQSKGTASLPQVLQAYSQNQLIQRFPRIGDDSSNLSLAGKWEDVSDFLEAHGQHAFYGFSRLYNQVTGDFIGDAGAKNLSVRLLTLLNGTLTSPGRASSQKYIMRKLAEIMELVRKARFNLAADKRCALKISRQLYKDSGLCFGFTQVFKEHSDWEQELWQSITTWTPLGGSTGEELSKLEAHMNVTVDRVSSAAILEQKSLNAVLLLKEAWTEMANQIPAEYGAFSSGLAGLTGTPGVAPISKERTTRLIKSDLDIRNLIISIQPIVGELSLVHPALKIEISTDGHSMMVSYSQGRIVFLEPEIWGIVECPTWDDLINNLTLTLRDPGFMNDFNGGFALDVDIHATDLPGQQPATASMPTQYTALLQALELDSLRSFNGIMSGSDPADFLLTYNNQMYNLLFPGASASNVVTAHTP